MNQHPPYGSFSYLFRDRVVLAVERNSRAPLLVLRIPKIMKLSIFLVGLSVIVGPVVQLCEGRLSEKYIWNELQFDWPSVEAKEEALSSGDYVPKHNLPLGLDVWRNKLFITVPR